jgi:ArsR family transcriptional regulator, arsenate/arsenite/antimonite-responsive transcriptional repressor
MTVMDNSAVLESTSVEVTAGFAALADETRLRILGVLEAGDRCVCELREEVTIAPNLLSYHLKVLREAGLVSAHRRGRWVDYRLEDDALDRLRSALPTTPRVTA